MLVALVSLGIIVGIGIIMKVLRYGMRFTVFLFAVGITLFILQHILLNVG